MFTMFNQTVNNKGQCIFTTKIKPKDPVADIFLNHLESAQSWSLCGAEVLRSWQYTHSTDRKSVSASHPFNNIK